MTLLRFNKPALKIDKSKVKTVAARNNLIKILFTDDTEETGYCLTFFD